MKKISCCFCLMVAIACGLSQAAYSQGINSGEVHAIDVARYSDYNPDYLTIIDPHVIEEHNSHSQTALTWEPKVQGDVFKIPRPGDIILEVNGISTYQMSPGLFYRIIDGKDSFIMRFIQNGKEYIQEFIIRKTPPTICEEWIPVNEFFCNHTEYPQARTFQDGLKGSTHAEKRDALFNDSSAICEEIQSQTFDFGSIHTYDYLIVGDDPLNDEKILNSLPKAGLTRDKNNPDILFTIAKRAEDQISSSYIPPQKRTIYTGSVTTPQYNYILRQYEYKTKNNYITQVEGGYTHTTKTSDFFLELAALDAKRINDSLLTHAPIVWKMTTTRSVVNADLKPTVEMAAYASWGCFSLLNREVVISRAFLPSSGLIGIGNTVLSVLPNSRASSAGFQPGDIIVKAKTKVFYIKKGEYSPSQNEYIWKDAYKTISVTNPNVDYFNESRLATVADDEYFPINDRSLSLYKKHANERVSGKDKPTSRGRYRCAYGWAPIYQDWEITILRNGKKMKRNLTAPFTYKVFDYNYLNP